MKGTVAGVALAILLALGAWYAVSHAGAATRRPSAPAILTVPKTISLCDSHGGRAEQVSVTGYPVMVVTNGPPLPYRSGYLFESPVSLPLTTADTSSALALSAPRSMDISVPGAREVVVTGRLVCDGAVGYHHATGVPLLQVRDWRTASH